MRFVVMPLCAAALLLLASGAVRAAADVARATALVESKCSLCHGMHGESSSTLYPRLGGQHAEYIAKQLQDFRAGRRKGEMTRFARGLSDEVIEGLAQYFSQQVIAPHASKDPELAAVGRYLFHQGNALSGVPACASCHGQKGEGGPRLPRLAGQQSPYIERQLKDFNQRERTNDNEVMHTVASKLTPLEIKALGEYISGMP